VPVTAVEEEDDDAAGGDRAATAVDTPQTLDGREVIVVPSASQPLNVERAAPKKLVVKTGQSRPKFPPVIITYDKEIAPIN
jgi:hypothetical protein